MSLRHLFSSSGLFIVLGLAIGISAQASASTKDSAVQTYTDQALPINAPATEAFQNAPLPAGSLTMEDVLRAHEPKDEPEPHAVPAATGLMMSQGMNSIFQRYKVPAIPKPIKAAPAMQPQAEIKVTAAPAAGGAQPKSALTAPTGVNYEAGQAPKNLEVAAEPVEKPERDKAETTYQPGQAPKNLAAAQADVLSPGLQASSPEPTSAKCTEKVQKWEKSCSEAGYPVTYVGKVYGETHTVCADGSLQDVWVKNTCLPPQEKPETTAPATASKQAKQQRNETFLNAGATPAAQASSAPEKKNPEKPKEVPSAVDSGKMAPASVRAEASLPRPPEPLPATSEEYCGEAAETLAYEAPEKNLCRVGAPSTVTGKGPWSWTCTNNTGAVSS
ncbi:MAG: hypothetical protein PHW76_10125 [Alphaproteobacteria bacterium]|nr:hypothetical protein [Alphaproteobacteria bacterium]